MSAKPAHGEFDDGADDRPRSFDAALKAALDDVPVPGDLAERLIARVEAEDVFRRSMPVAPGRLRRVRRWALMGIGSLALVALVVVGAFMWPRQREVAREDLGGEVASWMGSLAAKGWRPIAMLPRGVELDQAVLGRARQWQSIDAKSSNWSVTAIDLGQPTAPRAILFVVKSNARFAVPSAPTATVRLGLSSGYVGTAWQRSSGVLFVLVVEADRGQRLEDFLRKPAQA